MFRQEFILLIYNKDIVCVKDEGKAMICTTSPRVSRRNNADNEPSHDPYIPRYDTILFNCSKVCKLVTFNSMTQLTSPYLTLKSCYQQDVDHICESVKYNNYKNKDKVLFLSNVIESNKFYEVDCLIYSDGERVCHKKGDPDSYSTLIDTGTITRPNKSNILSQEELICEENPDKEINCDLNPYVPYRDGLKVKDAIQFGDKVLLRTGSYIVPLSRACIGSWCGYSGKVSATRRQFSYRPPGGETFRCYYAKRQQICKRMDTDRVYNSRGWLSSR